MCVGHEYRIDLRKLVKGNPWRADARQELAKRGVEIRVRQEPLSGKLN
jgi:hypothetical protein